jgi:hypothetical protein
MSAVGSDAGSTVVQCRKYGRDGSYSAVEGFMILGYDLSTQYAQKDQFVTLEVVDIREEAPGLNG